jgi:hypothetical protein
MASYIVVAKTRTVAGLLLIAILLVLIVYHGPLANYLLSWGAYLPRITCRPLSVWVYLSGPVRGQWIGGLA